MQRQYRTVGSVWVDCDEEMFNFCRRSAEYDTRSIPKNDIKPNNDITVARAIELKRDEGIKNINL